MCDGVLLVVIGMCEKEETTEGRTTTKSGRTARENRCCFGEERKEVMVQVVLKMTQECSFRGRMAFLTDEVVMLFLGL